MGFCGYIFDFDGTLFDTHAQLVCTYTRGFKLVGIDITPEDVAREMHFALTQTVTHYDLSEGNANRLIQEVRSHADDPEYLRLIKIFPDTVPTIRSLKAAGKRIAILSGNGEHHIRLLLKQFGIEDDFEFVIGRSPERRPKPSADPVLAALALWPEIDPKNIVYIGDSLQDSETAKNGGIASILLDRKNEYPDYEGPKMNSLSALLEEKG